MPKIITIIEGFKITVESLNSLLVAVSMILDAIDKKEEVKKEFLPDDCNIEELKK